MAAGPDSRQPPLVPFAPGVEDLGDALPICLEFAMAENRGLHLPEVDPNLAVSLAAALEQRLAERREVLPPVAQRVDVAVGDTAVQVGVEVVQILRLAGIDVARDVEVVVVGGIGDLGQRHHVDSGGSRSRSEFIGPSEDLFRSKANRTHARSNLVAGRVRGPGGHGNDCLLGGSKPMNRCRR